MSEKILYKKLKRATPGFDWERHEDKMTSGIPDTSYGAEGVGGWVELKTYDCWPRSPENPLVFTDLKPTQVNWVIARGRKHPLVWFLVQVADDWFLISWFFARQLGHLTKEQLLAKAHIHGTGPILKEIAGVLITGQPITVYDVKSQRYKVKFYHLAPGMNGKPDKWERIVEAISEVHAIDQVASGFPKESQSWLKQRLSASSSS